MSRLVLGANTLRSPHLADKAPVTVQGTEVFEP